MFLLRWGVLPLILTIVTCENLPQVQTPLGKIEGVSDRTVKGRNFFSFEGVPYAKPPVGNLRFKEAVPAEPWSDVWKANNKYKCLQYDHFSPEGDRIRGTEDCLYVNVYTPALDGKYDVIIHIHGGAFIFGSGSMFLPHILLDKNVVYVSINYRLGPLGFLSTEDDNVPGNNGLGIKY
ncbi:hypothetical protein WA026_005237 [Henosepilachna vigintioctopunctata]|uniref:Carboxylesterase type B domain-containing protein n=1 Tax=Henosepilachna vigintioctopunctata TaxID=420089 RepID=A0AAW1UWG8_9CUCU